MNERCDQPPPDFPSSAVDIVRAVLADAVTWKDIDPEQADPLAEAIVARPDAAGLLRNRPAPSVTEVAAVLREIPRDIRISADFTVGADRKPTGFITVPFDAAERLVTQLPERARPRCRGAARAGVVHRQAGGDPVSDNAAAVLVVLIILSSCLLAGLIDAWRTRGRNTDGE
jgi:hypothetical protein